MHKMRYQLQPVRDYDDVDYMETLFTMKDVSSHRLACRDKQLRGMSWDDLVRHMFILRVSLFTTSSYIEISDKDTEAMAHRWTPYDVTSQVFCFDVT